MFSAARQIGLDLGTANIVLYHATQGVLLHEPSVVAIEQTTNRVVAVGTEAQRMLGRTPGNIVAVRPLRQGVIADYHLTEAMLRYFLRKARVVGRLRRPIAMVCVPSGVTGVERRAVLDAVLQAGARQAHLIEEPMAAALGAGLDITQPRGTLVIDVGGGTTDIALMSLGGIVLSRSLRVAGDAIDEAIIRSIRRSYNVLIGERSAEEVKKALATATPDAAPQIAYELRGRDLVSGLPRNLRVTAPEIHAAIKDVLDEIVAGVINVLERTPPELAVDIIDKGMLLTGGGALLHGFDRYLSEKTGVPVFVPDEPLHCVAIGTCSALRQRDRLLLEQVM